MPGRKQMSLGGFIFIICFCSIFVVVGIGLTVAGINERSTYLALQAHGVRVQARVTKTRIYESTDHNGTTYHYYVDVTYPIASRIRMNEFECTEDDYSSHQAGSRIGVIYDPSDPTKAVLDGPSGAMVYRNNLTGGPIFALAGLLIMGITFYAWRKQNLGLTGGGTTIFSKRQL